MNHKDISHFRENTHINEQTVPFICLNPSPALLSLAVEIGKNIGITWDGIAENWDNFVSDVQKGLNNLIHAKKWIRITSLKGEAVMKAVYAYYTAGGGASGGKKDDKWYFEARLRHKEIEINPERMNEEQAVKKMEEGKDIMTLTKKLATDS